MPRDVDEELPLEELELRVAFVVLELAELREEELAELREADDPELLDEEAERVLRTLVDEEPLELTRLVTVLSPTAGLLLRLADELLLADEPLLREAEDPLDEERLPLVVEALRLVEVPDVEELLLAVPEVLELPLLTELLLLEVDGVDAEREELLTVEDSPVPLPVEEDDADLVVVTLVASFI